MGFSSAFAWIWVFWITAAVSRADNLDVGLQVEPRLVAKCGENVTLSCNASSSRNMDIKLFSWVATSPRAETLCQYGVDQSSASEALCESTAGDDFHHTLTLHLRNLMPDMEGKYICKLQSKLGAKDASTFLALHGCLNRSGSHVNESRAECWFTGVYARAVVHWFQGDENLTDFSSTVQEEGQHGRFNVRSDLDVQKGNMSRSYNCSLWTPSGGKYLSSRQLTVVRKARSSGRTVTLQWLGAPLWVACVLHYCIF